MRPRYEELFRKTLRSAVAADEVCTTAARLMRSSAPILVRCGRGRQYTCYAFWRRGVSHALNLPANAYASLCIDHY